MKIIISPAKKMNTDHDGFTKSSKPYFFKEANKLFNYLKSLSIEELKKIWKCNDSIAAQNYDRLQINSMEQNTTPAIFSYDGIQYKYMSPDTMDENALNYIQENLFILSGLYGAVKPFDAVIPYRLEMQSKFQNWDYLNLYKFWGSKIAEYIYSQTDIIINAASSEYSKVISPFVPEGKKLITCLFCENIDGTLKEKGTLCKMARGAFVRFMAENNIETAEEIKKFNSMGYFYSEENSEENTITFIKGEI